MIYNNYHKHTHISNIFTPDVNDKAEDFVKQAVDYGHKNYFTTEHGSMGDIFEAKTVCDKYGIRCIPGIEGYIVPDPKEKDKSNYHIVIIPQTNSARKKINYCSSMANIRGFYYKPRLSLDDLFTLDKDDVFITTACIAGLLRDEVSIERILLPLVQHFGNNVFLEVQNHDVEIQKEINLKALTLHEELGLNLIAANDSHYVKHDGYKERLELLKGKGITYDDEDTFILDYPSYEEMKRRFIKQGVLTEKQIDQAIKNTLIFDNCEEIKLDKSIKMPSIYKDLTPKERYKKLESEVWDKFDKIRQKENIPESEVSTYEDGIRYELKTIEDTNEEIHTADYFLFNEKNVELAVNKYGGVLTRGGRGSCGSFYINKILGMTQLDRFKINLPIFPDRFASTARLLENRALPDIDYNVVAQEPFVKASKELLGEHGCYPMIAYGTMQLSEAFRNVCRSKNIPHSEYNDVGKNIEAYENDKKWKPIISEAKKYVGTIVSASVHPCAHLLLDEDILYEFGVVKIGDALCVMMTSSEADEYKFLKNDYLIVKVWKLISETFQEINKPIMDAHDLLNSIKDDKRVWDLFKNGITCTLNQVDSDNGMRQAKQYEISSFEDGAFIAAAIRPSFDSWREQFLNRVDYSTGSKDLDKVLDMTHHYILFQENLMQYFEWLGVTPAESIGLIKKISKKKIKQEDFDNLEVRLKDNWVKNTGSDSMFNETWEMIQSCIAYGFCVSGDTKLKRNGNGSKFIPTVSEMYNILHDRKFAKETGHINLHDKYLRSGYGKALSMDNDNLITQNDIVDIYYMGERDTFTVTTESGKSIRCTKEHKHPTKDGIKMTKELKIGDELFIVGNYQDRQKYNLTNNNFIPNTPKKGQMGFQKKPNGPSVVYNNAVSRHQKNKDCCECCGIKFDGNIRFELHHKDFESTHNNEENYEWLCNSCHKKKHYKHGRNKRYERKLTTYTEKVVKIDYYGIEPVYNVEMKDPYHNYAIDNGIITANCSAHAAATSLDMCYGAYLKVNYPFEYYTVCFNNYIGDTIRTNKLRKELEYFNIQLGDVKFGFSRGKYSYDKSSRVIYKGISSIKFMNDTVPEQMYNLRNNKYSTFVDLLFDLKTKTSLNSRQRDILIRIDFFKEFGDINKLIKICELFDEMYGKQSISQTKAEEYGISQEFFGECSFKPRRVDYIDFEQYANDHGINTNELSDCIRKKRDGSFNGYNINKFIKKYNPSDEELFKYATKIIDGRYSNYNLRKVLTNYFIKMNDVPVCTLPQKIKYQLEFLGYVDYKNDSLNNRYIVVTDLDTTYTPRFKAYCIKSGDTCDIKVKKRLNKKDPAIKVSYAELPFEDGDILYMTKCRKENKRKKTDDGWVNIPNEFDWVITDYRKVNNIA